jgi:two-component system sensor histidine kinase KdpD
MLGVQRTLLQELGGEYHELASADPATTLVQFAQNENATQIVLGASRQSRWTHLLRGSVINNVIRASDTIDVHVIVGGRRPHTGAGSGRCARRRPGRRGLPAAGCWPGSSPSSCRCSPCPGEHAARSPFSDLLMFLLVVVVVARSTARFVPAFVC